MNELQLGLCVPMKIHYISHQYQQLMGLNYYVDDATQPTCLHKKKTLLEQQLHTQHLKKSVNFDWEYLFQT